MPTTGKATSPEGNGASDRVEIFSSSIQVRFTGVECQGNGSRTYLVQVACVALFTIGGLYLGLGCQERDHFAAISPDGDPAWYQDLAGDYVTEIQDQDLFFHNIGRSIEYARKADIVMLGSSLASFALSDDVMRDRIQKPYGLRFYNMAFVGIASGEFSRRIIEKYELRPRLWIINADDGGGGGGGGNFFSRSLVRSFSADVKTIGAIQHGRLRAYYDVVRRNLRWRAEDAVSRSQRWRRPSNPVGTIIPKFYRSDETGAADMRFFPHYLAEGNQRVKMTRDPDCHTTPEVVAIARDFVRAVGSRVVLTLAPNFHGCLTQVREIADAVGVETALPGRTDYSSWDGGGHLDRKGSIEFTGDLVSAPEGTAAFEALNRKYAR